MKLIASLAAAGTLALAATAALAQPATPPQAPGQTAPEARRAPLTSADREALTDARIAAIQAGLRLTPEQQGLWSPVERALRDQAATRAKRIEERGAARAGAERPDLMQRLDRRAERVRERADALQAFTAAMRPFWASLTDDQKRRLPLLMRTARVEERGGRMGDRHGRRHGMRDGHGAGPHRL